MVLDCLERPCFNFLLPGWKLTPCKTRSRSRPRPSYVSAWLFSHLSSNHLVFHEYFLLPASMMWFPFSHFPGHKTAAPARSVCVHDLPSSSADRQYQHSQTLRLQPPGVASPVGRIGTAWKIHTRLCLRHAGKRSLAEAGTEQLIRRREAGQPTDLWPADMFTGLW